jgi:two-component system nitrogen regulation response regulator NtrX
MALLLGYSWPGNVRELANVVERLSILHLEDVVTGAHVAAVLRSGLGDAGAPPLPPPERLDASLTETIDDFERTLIRRALGSADNNIAEAARRLQTDRPNLYRRMKRLGLVDNGG